MGPSGSSKTTLLDVLAARKTIGTLTGTLLFGGQRASQSFLRRYIGYVEQFGESYREILKDMISDSAWSSLYVGQLL